MKNIWRLIKLIPEYRWKVAAVVALSTLLGLTNIIVPYLFKNIIDQVAKLASPGHNTSSISQQITYYLIILGLVRIVIIALGYLQERFSDLLFLQILTSLRSKLFEHLLGLSIDYYEKTKAGEIMQRYSNGIADLCRWIEKLSFGALVNILSLIFYVVLVANKNAYVGLIIVIVIPLNIYNAISKVRATKPIRKLWLADAEQAFGTINESVTNVATIRSFAAESVMRQRYYHWIGRFQVNRIGQVKVEWRANVIRGVLNMVATLSSVGIMAQGALRGHYSPGDLYLVLQLTSNIMNSLSPITRLITDTGDVETSAERVCELLDIAPTVSDASDAIELESIGTVEFKNVSFRYPGKRRQILNNVSFKILPGQSLALVGPSGTGKSTVIKLLMRFYDPTEGQILIDGQDIRRYSQNSLRRLLGVVMQDVALLNDTIEANLRFANADAKRSTVREAAIIAHADVFIDKLSDKYQTLVGERGVKLSGGEKQRVAIARAILRDPKLIILDEATSALDSESERYVQDGLQSLMAGRTAVIIAHRLSTVMQADQIVVLKNGKVVERGTHEQLTTRKRSGLYARLYSLQTSGELK